jgi:hypothetical protein
MNQQYLKSEQRRKIRENLRFLKCCNRIGAKNSRLKKGKIRSDFGILRHNRLAQAIY